MSDLAPPMTPDKRYLVGRRRLWRQSDPSLPKARQTALMAELITARRKVGTTLREGDQPALAAARAEVDVAKVALGGRGPVLRANKASDLNRRMAANVLYTSWSAGLEETA